MFSQKCRQWLKKRYKIINFNHTYNTQTAFISKNDFQKWQQSL